MKKAYGTGDPETLLSIITTLTAALIRHGGKTDINTVVLNEEDFKHAEGSILRAEFKGRDLYLTVTKLSDADALALEAELRKHEPDTFKSNPSAN